MAPKKTRFLGGVAARSTEVALASGVGLSPQRITHRSRLTQAASLSAPAGGPPQGC
jgi:hypothetical protein